MKKPDIDIIFFDAGGVLLEWAADPREAIAQHLDLPATDVKEAHKRSLTHTSIPKWESVNSPERENEFGQEAAKALLHELNLPVDQSQVDIIASKWQKIPHKLVDGVIETLDYLAADYRLAMISNAPPSRRTWELVELGLIQYFDPIVLSGEFGARKPDPTIYLEALRLANIEPNRAAFIDDVESFLESAKQLDVAMPILFDRFGESSGEFQTIKNFSELRDIF